MERPINNWRTQRFRLAPSGSGTAEPYLIQSCRPDDSFSTIDSTVAVQTKGFAFLFQPAMNSVIACSRPWLPLHRPTMETELALELKGFTRLMNKGFTRWRTRICNILFQSAVEVKFQAFTVALADRSELLWLE